VYNLSEGYNYVVFSSLININAMKRLIMIAAVAVAALSAKAHNFHNDSPCDVEFRVVCIDPITCTVTSVSSGWMQVPAFSFVSIPPGCIAPDEIGYEVQYDAASTGCTSPSVIVKHDPGTYSTTNCGINNVTLPSCACNTNGVNVHVNPDNVHIQPL
jgi:hypothetical protein